jgi:hypothetical protein
MQELIKSSGSARFLGSGNASAKTQAIINDWPIIQLPEHSAPTTTAPPGMMSRLPEATTSVLAKSKMIWINFAVTMLRRFSGKMLRKSFKLGSVAKAARLANHFLDLRIGQISNINELPTIGGSSQVIMSSSRITDVRQSDQQRIDIPATKPGVVGLILAFGR